MGQPFETFKEDFEREMSRAAEAEDLAAGDVQYIHSLSTLMQGLQRAGDELKKQPPLNIPLKQLYGNLDTIIENKSNDFSDAIKNSTNRSDTIKSRNVPFLDEVLTHLQSKGIVSITGAENYTVPKPDAVHEEVVAFYKKRFGDMPVSVLIEESLDYDVSKVGVAGAKDRNDLASHILENEKPSVNFQDNESYKNFSEVHQAKGAIVPFYMLVKKTDDDMLADAIPGYLDGAKQAGQAFSEIPALLDTITLLQNRINTNNSKGDESRQSAIERRARTFFKKDATSRNPKREQENQILQNTIDKLVISAASYNESTREINALKGDKSENKTRAEQIRSEYKHNLANAAQTAISECTAELKHVNRKTIIPELNEQSSAIYQTVPTAAHTEKATDETISPDPSPGNDGGGPSGMKPGPR